jgi:cytochrome c biogenesis protein CcdA
MKERRILTLLVLGLFLLSMSSLVLAQQENQTNVYFFWGDGCPHCQNVKDSGVLGEISKIENVKVFELEVYLNQSNRDRYAEFADKFDISVYNQNVPFLVIECNDKYSYLIGDGLIIKNLRDKDYLNKIINCDFPSTNTGDIETYTGDIESTGTSSSNPNSGKLTLGSIIIAALIDSINPCAFGVLLFLWTTMLSMGSSKRALKYGLVYIFVIFLVYFSAGLGIIKILNEFSGILNYIVITAGILVFIGGLIELKDFFWYGKGISLKIPVSTKPTIEKIIKKGTLPAVILLGFFVTLVELPCTGGIYLAILSIMHINKTFGIPYLLLYNFIFVLPLIIMVFMAYYGVKAEKIQTWVENNKKWMRLAAGIVMIGLALYLLNSVYNWI